MDEEAPKMEAAMEEGPPIDLARSQTLAIDAKNWQQTYDMEHEGCVSI